ncbi:hypothetical protein D5F01_LYC05640 [Larimichthys crocea]|uniref:Uncharacterized protein n=1 Tax=Larimichthys crocea TaxID=215358 RepID=A0A6G0IZJ6_LARCR|nr:hypothetical protein D5F01_LYC05640 [Larimichthys crocea]
MNHFRQSDRSDEDTCMKLNCMMAGLTLPILSLEVVIDSEHPGASVTPSGLQDLRLAVASIYSDGACHHEYFTRLLLVGVVRRCGLLLPGLCSAANHHVITNYSRTPSSFVLCQIIPFITRTLPSLPPQPHTTCSSPPPMTKPAQPFAIFLLHNKYPPSPPFSL